MNLAVPVDYACRRLIAHARRPALVDILSKDAEFTLWRSHVGEFHLVEDGSNVTSHGYGHCPIILPIAGANVERRNTPSVLLVAIQRDEIVRSGKALSLGFDGKIVRDVLLDPLAPCITKLWKKKGVAINLLAAVAVKTISAEEIRIAVFLATGIHVLRYQESTRPPDRFPLRGAQARHIAASALNREVIH